MDQIRAEKCRRSLTSFIRHFWHIVEPETPLIWNWHIEVIAEHLEAVTRMQLWNVDKEPRPEKSIDSLIINIPPGHMKSLIVCVFWPAWEWVNWPHLQSIFASYALALAQRDSMRCRDIIVSDQYQSWFQPKWKILEDRNTIKVFGNTRGGVRQCIAIGAGTTGFRGHKIVVDDALNATDATSDIKRTAANKWFDRAASSRLNDLRKACKVNIGQRLHEDDLTGHLITKGYYDHLCLPSEFVPGESKRTSIGFEDPRTEFGELLFPVLFNQEAIERAKKDLGSEDYQAQHGQKPSPPGGSIFKTFWWRYWQLPGMNLPPVRIEMPDGEIRFVQPVTLPGDFEEVINSWDMSFKDSAKSDLVSGQEWGKRGANSYLLDRIGEKASFTESVRLVTDLRSRNPRVSTVLIEDAANGPAIINTLRNIIPGIVPVSPGKDSKTARGKSITPYLEAGNVFVPHPDMPGYHWVKAYLNQFTNFPTGAHDDDVDAGVHALRRFYRGGTEQKSTSSYRPLPQTQPYIPR